MGALTRWFIANPVAANLLMLFILIAGWLSFQSARIESFPQLPASQLIVEVTYPGGTAKQVDEGITQRIEDAVSGIAGIKSINSSSYPGFASIRIKKNTGIKLDKLLEQVRNQVDAIVGFPERAERPIIYRDEFGSLASFVMIYGGDNDAEIQDVATRVANQLKKHPQISKVENLGKRRKQLVIELDELSLKNYGLNYQQVIDIIHEWSLEYRTGELNSARGKIILKADNFADTLPALKALPVITDKTGVVHLEDIASVRRDYQETDSLVRYKGLPAIALMIHTSQKDNLLKVSEATKQVLAEVQTELPTGIKTDVMADMAPYIADQLNLLGTNAWQGLLIVLVLLGLFLEIRLAFWVAMGIPVSIAGAVWLMGIPSFNYTINDITLFGMILALGILVDDAVVVGESIHQARTKIDDPKEAAWQGVKAVSTATIFGVLTTIAAFSPMLWIENELAQVLAGFSAVVIFALIFSLIESKFILPTHLAFEKNKTAPNKLLKQLSIIKQHFIDALDWFAHQVYKPILQQALTNKGWYLGTFLLIVILAYGAMAKGAIQSVFFPEIPGRFASLHINMDQDAPADLTRSNIEALETAIIETNAEIKKQFNLPVDAIEQYLLSMEGAKKIEVTVALSNQALSDVPSNRFLNEWRQQIGEIEGSYSTKFTWSEEVAGGTFITVSAPTTDNAMAAAAMAKQYLAQLPGVNDVIDDSQSGKRQLQVTLNENGIQLGITQRQLALIVGGAFGEIEIHRLLDKGEEATVVMRLPKQATKTVQQLKNTPVQINDNYSVNLSEIAEFSYSRQPEVIYRKNRDQVISISWHQDKSISSPESTLKQLQSELFPQIQQQFPQVSVSAAGEFDEIGSVQAGFKKAMLLTLMLIYILLAIPLKSYWQPLIIMSVIPFGFAGAIYGHGILGMPVSLLSLFGMMAMTGVVINDSLVLMTRFNQLYRSGMPAVQALVEAGTSRLRAIFLTTVTTVFGLLPLLSETSEQAQYLKPAAISLVFGELFATPITLLIIPVLLGFRYKNKVAETH